jgi:hypothetical protein
MTSSATPYLLDVAPLLSLLWEGHEHHRRTMAWQQGQPAISVCPLTELGFLRISTQPAYGATFAEAKIPYPQFPHPPLPPTSHHAATKPQHSGNIATTTRHPRDTHRIHTRQPRGTHRTRTLSKPQTSLFSPPVGCKTAP